MNAPVLAQDFPEAHDLVERLISAGLTIGTAESCTGGLCCAVLTASPGASLAVRGAVVAYANPVKTELLGVTPADIADHGAVSEQVAAAMAGGIRRVLACDIGVGITGVAGPGTDRPSKPPGLVYVACAGPGVAMRVVRLDRDLGREGNRAAAVHAALALVGEAMGHRL